MSLTRGAVGWYAVCDCDIFWSYTLIVSVQLVPCGVCLWLGPPWLNLRVSLAIAVCELGHFSLGH